MFIRKVAAAAVLAGCSDVAESCSHAYILYIHYGHVNRFCYLLTIILYYYTRICDVRTFSSATESEAQLNTALSGVSHHFLN